MRVFFTLSWFFLIFTVVGQAYPVFIDGNYDEWGNSTNIHDDKTGDGNSIDLLRLKLLNDKNNLYILLKVEEDIYLNTGNYLEIYIDTDNNPETGLSINTIGAEIKWAFGSRNGTAYIGSSSTDIWQNDILIRAQPTVSDSEFEIAINRNININESKIFTNDTVKLFVKVNESLGDYLPDEGKVISYTFDNTEIPDFEEISLSRKSNNHIRTMTYNVLYDGISNPDRKMYFERIIKAANPDIITFNECWDTQTSYIIETLNSWLPQDNTWYASKVVDGNITASRFPILKSTVAVQDRRLAASLIDLPDKYGQDLMVVNCHLKCCNSESINVTRQNEVDGLHSFIKKIKNNESDFVIEENTPFMFLGDFNLVGDAQQLRTLINGEIINTDSWGEGGLPDWNNTPMGDVISKGVGMNMAYTWRNDYSEYWPGRLDFIFYTKSQLNLEKSFILETRYMSNETLSENNLFEDDSRKASDHFPHIADFSLKSYSKIEKDKSQNLNIYPNPCSNEIYISADNLQINEIKVMNINGLQVKTINSSIDKLDMSELQTGIYFVSINTNKGVIVKKVFKTD